MQVALSKLLARVPLSKFSVQVALSKWSARVPLSKFSKQVLCASCSEQVVGAISSEPVLQASSLSKLLGTSFLYSRNTFVLKSCDFLAGAAKVHFACYFGTQKLRFSSRSCESLRRVMLSNFKVTIFQPELRKCTSRTTFVLKSCDFQPELQTIDSIFAKWHLKEAGQQDCRARLRQNNHAVQDPLAHLPWTPQTAKLHAAN